ncbi:MAG: restriction endonuclease subunit S [Acinetobacter johnsonii]
MTDVKQLITEHLDIWLTAETEKKSGRGRSSGANDTIYGVQKLRELILDLALTGKLTNHDLNDYSASLLIKEFKEYKQLLVEEGKLKKEKPLPKLEPNELDFHVPVNWQLKRLGDVSTTITKGTTPTTLGHQYTESGIKFIKVESLDKGYIDPTSVQYISEETHQILRRSQLEAGDLLFSIAGTIGKIGLVRSQDLPANTNQALAIIKGTSRVFNSSFLHMQLSSSISNSTRAKARGGAMNNISLSDLSLLTVTIPPLTEQKQIVQKVDELMQLCDQLEQQQTLSSDAHATLVNTLLKALTESSDADEFQSNWQRIVANFDLLFSTDYSIEQLKQTVLQLAVMGKLVKQDPSDEPASELLKKIADEKAKLIKEGKIKKSKPLPEITEEEKPFELPSGWEFFRLQELGNFCGGKTPSKANPAYWDGTIPWVSPKDMKLEEIYDSEDHVTALAIQDGLELLPPNSLLFVVRSGILRRTFPLAITKEEVTINQDIKALKLYDFSVIEYLVILFKGFEKHILTNLTKTGTTVESLKVDDFINYPFIIPPLNEQKRIVEKVNQLFSMIEQLQVLQSKLQKTKIYLADALVANAVEGV